RSRSSRTASLPWRPPDDGHPRPHDTACAPGCRARRAPRRHASRRTLQGRAGDARGALAARGPARHRGGRCGMIPPPVLPHAAAPGLGRLCAPLAAEPGATRGPIVYPAHGPADLDNFTLLTARRVEHDPTLLMYVAVDDDTGELVGYLGGEVSERAIGEPRLF